MDPGSASCTFTPLQFTVWGNSTLFWVQQAGESELKRMQSSEVWNRDGFVSLSWKLAPAVYPNPAVRSSISYFPLLFRSLRLYLCADYRSSPFPNCHSVVWLVSFWFSSSFSFLFWTQSYSRFTNKWITWGRELCLPLLIEQICFPLGCR